ncbi:IclR family transcriptional regulator [Caballeronia sp. LZ029]|uniref:IclR family transcriptional regulator n=1 Tax=Caballeronia sp. LZ029 TaxID=3038564 RepID=UPI00286334AD|nr:IclR family transcriptional regulator [Caballeronia sp. LZ029]MDR5744639.1 IclR family transcriptional regulator [Caballeronia sp. LZ029]
MLNVDPQKPESTALRAFAVLEYVAHANTPVSLDDVTHACKLPKPTVFRILSMLFEADLVYREPLGKRYTVGARSAALALDVLRHSTLRSQPHTVLQELVDAVGETCNLTILDGNQVLYLDRVETPMPLRLHLEPGTRVPLHCTASGKLFLMNMTQKQIEALIGKPPYKRFTSRTITEWEPLKEELARARETGVGLHDSELFDDSVAIAVPLSDTSGRVYAALALHGPTSRLDIAACLKLLPDLRGAASAIADAMAPLSKQASPMTQSDSAELL